MATKYHQISLSESFSGCQNMFIDEPPSFFQILSDHFDLFDFIPFEFYSAFYLSLGHSCTYSLHAFLSAFILQKIVERAIKHFKINMCIAGRKTRSHTTTKADVFLADISSQLTVIVAYAVNCPQYLRSLKPLVA